MKLPPSTSVLTKSIHIDPANPRNDLALEALKRSIAQHGILQPPGLRHDVGRGCLFTIWGNRRVRAAQELGLEEIPAFIFEQELPPGEIAVYRAIENEQRLDLKPSERGRTYRELMGLKQITAKEVAELLNISPPTVSRHLAILSHPGDILVMIDDGTLPLSTGVSLARVPDEETRRDLVRQIREGHFTRDQVEDAVKGALGQRELTERKECLRCKVGDVSVNISAPELTSEALIGALARLLRQARRAKERGQDLSALAAQLKREVKP